MMPRPDRYVSRSDLGWGRSPAAAANPKLGLVIHYDGSNQNLAAKTHAACISYWKNTRAFHTGPARDRKSTRLNSSHVRISYAVFCLKKKNEVVLAETRLEHSPGEH